MKVHLCEKPDQAKHIAEFLNMTPVHRRNGYYERDGSVVVSPTKGHAIVFCPPVFYEPELKYGWSFDLLPILPEKMQMQIRPDGLKQWKVIYRLIKKADEVVIATDPDPEGEAIARNILERCNYTGPVSRALYVSTDHESLKEAFENLKPLSHTDWMFDVQRARAQTDWLLGMNLTQAMSLVMRRLTDDEGLFNVGSVIIPAAELVAKRSEEVESFTVLKHYGLELDVEIDGVATVLKWKPPEIALNEGMLTDLEVIKKAQLFISKHKEMRIVSLDFSEIEQQPPLPLDSDTLYAICEKNYSMDPSDTAHAAQSLYRPRSLTYYPRTDSRYLPKGLLKDASLVLAHLLSQPAFSHAKSMVDSSRVSKAWDSSQIRVHHGIIPTRTPAETGILTGLERHVYEEVAKYYLVQFMEPALQEKYSLKGMVGKKLYFQGSFTNLKSPGWRSFLRGEEAGPGLPTLPESGNVKIISCRVIEKSTTAKPLFTAGTLSSALKKISTQIENPELKSALQDKGIGTPGTRPELIKKAIKVGLLDQRQDKKIVPGEKYKLLRPYLSESLKSPNQSAIWQRGFKAIEDGVISVEDFITFQHGYIQRLISDAREVYEKLS